MPHDKLHRDKEAEKQMKQDELQQESNRLENMRKEIERAQKELNSDIRNLQSKWKKQRQAKRTNWKQSVYENNAAT